MKNLNRKEFRKFCQTKEHNKIKRIYGHLVTKCNCGALPDFMVELWLFDYNGPRLCEGVDISITYCTRCNLVFIGSVDGSKTTNLDDLPTFLEAILKVIC